MPQQPEAKRVYLAGPPYAEEYRRRAETLVLALGWEPLDPMRRDYRGRTEGNETEIVEGDLAEIAACDAMLSGCADYLLRNGHQSVPPEPLSGAKKGVVWVEVEPDQELARAEFAEAATAVSTTTMANASLVVRCLGATGMPPSE